RAAPALQADFDHLFEPAGAGLLPLHAALAATAGIAGGRTVGMIDGGVASHPSLADAAIEQNGFAGSPQPTGHGTAVASLLVGNQGPFRGAATGAQLYVADVYGGNQAAGSASVIVRALGWRPRGCCSPDRRSGSPPKPCPAGAASAVESSAVRAASTPVPWEQNKPRDEIANGCRSHLGRAVAPPEFSRGE